MNKKKPFILALMLTFSCTSACGIMTACNGCGDENKLNIIESNDGYDWKYNQNFVDEMDADMKIDGKLDEARWKENGKKWLTHTEKNVNMRYTTSFTAKGLYIAAEAKDPLMQWNETRDFANNSSFYFYIISENATEYHAFDCMGFYVDELHSACRQNTRFAAKASRTVDENGVPTLTAEFFSSWEALNYSVDEATGIPESAKFIPEYRFVEAVDSKENAYLKPALAEHGGNRVDNAYKFSKDGYINVDAEGAELGNGDNGFAKSDGWDLSEVKGGESGVKKITSNVYGDQAIFFKGINSSRYSYSVDIEYKETYGNPDFPAAGVFDMKDAADFNIMRFQGKDITAGSNSFRYFLLDFHNGRRDNQQGTLSVTPGTRKITVRVIKDDSRYYYIFGDYEYSTELSWLGGKTIPGLYTFDAEVEFSNWQVTDYEGAEKDAAFAELCAQYMHTVNVDTSISGGTVAVDKLAVRKDADEKVNVSVTPTRGYVLTDLTVNGKSEYDALLSRMNNGVITLTPDKALEIGATFSAMPAAETLRITGTVKRGTGENLIGMSYSVRSNDPATAKLLYNYGATTSSGIFDITVLRAGTHNIGGKTVTTDGKYTLTFDGIFPRGENNQFVIDTSDEKFTGKNYFDWGDVVVNPLKVVNMAETEDGRIQTTHTVYDSSQIFSYYIGNDTVTGSFQLDMTISAGNDKWPCYGFTIEDENNNSLQLFAAGATTFRIMKGYDGINYTQTDKNATFIDGESRIRLIYSEKDDTFSFYVNDILFETLKRTDYLTGTQFKYGPVGYMSGADGSNSEVTEANPFASFTKPAVTKVFELTVPEGAIITTADGTVITDGKVPVLSTVTVTIPVTAGQLYTIYVDGSPVETLTENGNISATFDVGANSEVTYKASYELNGTVSFGNAYPELKKDISLEGTEILVAGENGNIIYTTTSDKDGKFKVVLPDGKFFIGAKGATLVSDSLEITVEDGVASEAADLVLDKPAIREQLFNLELKYDAKTGNYVSANGHGQKVAGYLAGADVGSGKAYGATVTMKNLGSDWPSGGFAIGTSSDKFVKFEIVKAGDGTYILRIKDELSDGEVLWWFRDIAEFRKYNSLSEFEFTVIYSGGNYYLFLEGDMLVTVPETQALGGTTIKASVGSGKNVHLGLYGEEKITFEGWEYTFEAEDIKAVIGRKLTLADGLTATVNGTAVSDGEVLLGDTVTLSVDVPAGKNYTILIDGKAVATENKDGKATATLTVTGNHNVEYALSYAVSGNVEGGDENTVITIATTSGEIIFTATGATFETMLADGEYIVTAQGENKVSGGVKFSVSGGAVEDIKVKTDKLKITTVLQDFNNIPYNAATGELSVKASGQYNNGGYFGSVDDGKPFVITANVRKFDGAWWSAGFAVGESASSYSRFVIRHRGDGSNVYDIVAWHKTNTDQPALPEGLKDNPFTEEGDIMNIALVYNGGTYYLFVGDTLVHAVNQSNGSGAINVGLFCEQNVTYADWGYSTELSKVDKYLGYTLTAEGITATVGGKEVTDGKVMLGDEVTVTVEVEAGQQISFVLDGKALETKIENGKATATFKVTGDHTVTYSVTYAVSGSTEAGATVTFANADGSVAKTVEADGEGKFSVELPNGTYYVSARTQTLVSAIKAVTVEDGAATAGTITPEKLLITKPVTMGADGKFEYNLVTGEYVSDNDPNHAGYFATVEDAGNGFAITAKIKKFGADNYPSAGFIVETEKGYQRFNLRWRPEGDWSCYDGVHWDVNGKNTDIVLKNNQPFGEGTEAAIALVYNNGTYYFIVAGEIAYTVNNYAAPAGKIGLFCERAITYTEWGYSAETDKFISATITAEEISVTVGGKEVTDGKVMLGDEVTVTVEVEAGQQISFVLDGKALETKIENGKATATFKVTGDHTVTYSVTYAVSGSTEAGATVTFANADGSVAKTVEADGEGKFSVELPNSTYYVSAKTAVAVSTVTKLTVNGAAKQLGEITLERRLITETLQVGQEKGEFSFDLITGAYKTVADAANNCGYFAQEENAAQGILIGAQISKFTDNWYSAGFAVETEAGVVRFVLRKNGDSPRYDGVSWNEGNAANIFFESDKFNPDVTNPFENAEEAAISLAFANGTYYFFVNGTIAYKVSGYNAPTGKIGLFCERAITYVEWNYSTDRSDLFALVGATVTGGENIVLTVGGKEVTDGKVMLGDEVTVTVEVEAGQEISIIAGVPLETEIKEGKATAKFTVTGDCTVSYSVTYSVGGTSEEGATINVINPDGSVFKTVEVGAGGTFTVTLPNGSYKLQAVKGTFISVPVSINVDNAVISGLSVVPDKLRLEDNNFTKIELTAEGYYQSSNNSEGEYNANNGGYFAGSAVDGAVVVKAKVNKFTDNWYSAGFAVETEAGVVRFVLRKNGDSPRYDGVSWNEGNAANIFFESDKFNPDVTNPFENAEEAAISLAFANGTYYFFVNGTIAYKVSGYGAPKGMVGLFCERTITYTEWSYTTATEELFNYVGATVTGGEGITLTVGGTEVTDGKVFIGDTVTVSVEVAEGQNVAIRVDEKAVETTIEGNKATATFTVKGNHKVDYSSTFTVSGTTTAGATVTFANSDGSIAKQVTADGDGNFSWALPDGTYYVSAQTETYISAVTTVTVEGSAQSNVNLATQMPKLLQQGIPNGWGVDTGTFIYDVTTGKYHGKQGTFYTGKFADVSAKVGTAWAVSATVNIVSNMQWPSAGILLMGETPATQNVKFEIVRNTDADPNIYLFRVRDLASGSDNKTTFTINYNTENCAWLRTNQAKLAGDVKLTLVSYNSAYYLYIGDELAFAVTGENANKVNVALGGENITAGFYCEHNVTFADWSVKTENVEVPAEARLKGFDGVTTFNFDVNSGAFKSVRNNNNQRSVTDIDVKDVTEWVYSADLHILSVEAWPSLGLALFNSDNSASYIVKIIRNCSNNVANDQWCQLKVGDTDYGADPNGNDTQKWVDAHKFDMKGEVNMALVHNANGLHLFINNEFVVTATGLNTDSWDKVCLGLFAEQETSARNLRYSTDISGYEIPA